MHPNEVTQENNAGFISDAICISISVKIRSNLIMSSAGRFCPVRACMFYWGSKNAPSPHMSVCFHGYYASVAWTQQSHSRHTIQGIQKFVTELNITSIIFFVSYAAKADLHPRCRFGRRFRFSDEVYERMLRNEVSQRLWTASLLRAYNIINIWDVGRAR